MTTSYANVSRASQLVSRASQLAPDIAAVDVASKAGGGWGGGGNGGGGEADDDDFLSWFGRLAPGIDWAASSKFKITSRDGDPEISWLDPQAAPAAEADTKSRSPPESWIDRSGTPAHLDGDALWNAVPAEGYDRAADDVRSAIADVDAPSVGVAASGASDSSEASANTVPMWGDASLTGSLLQQRQLVDAAGGPSVGSSEDSSNVLGPDVRAGGAEAIAPSVQASEALGSGRNGTRAGEPDPPSQATGASLQASNQLLAALEFGPGSAGLRRDRPQRAGPDWLFSTSSGE